MGLLDGLDSDVTRFGLGLLAASGSNANFGQNLASAVGSLDQFKQQQAAAKRAKMQEEFQAFQMQQARAQAAQQAAAQAQDEKLRAGMGQFFKPGQQALAPLMGDASIGILPSDGRAATAPSFDAGGAAQFLAQNGQYEKALSMMPKPEKSPINNLDVKDFTPASVAKFAQSRNYADLVRMDKAHFGDSGGQLLALDPFTGKPLNSINKTQSPDNKASTAVSWANYGLAKERLNHDVNGGGEGGQSQAGLNKLFGKPQAGYRWKPDGSMEFIPGGPADQKAQAQKGGEGTVGGIVADLRDKYTQLDADNGIVSTNNRFGTNIGARIGSTGFGQALGGTFGTSNQNLRDSVNMTRPLLLQAIMKATGMSAKQMDSNAELKLYLATATDPTKGLQANMEALDRIESLYGGGGEKFNSQRPVMPSNSGWKIQKAD